MGLSIKSKIWWPGMDFACPKCGEYCVGEDNSMEISGERVLRWCGNCSYQEIGRKDSLCDLNIESIKRNVEQFYWERFGFLG